MSGRLAAGLFVAALRRRVEAGGGAAMVLARGDATAGAVLIVIADRGVTQAVLERTLDDRGRYRWTETGPGQPDLQSALGDYIARRHRADPDLWVVELDGPDARRIADEVAGED